ncbi:hypothetical protein [Niallia taxi]|uniref:hypothetical protein n=1 Tax=Niallia taxi TaxID=2499688 RepID=UPI0015F5C5D0|nr:hypothetical protein [Niallia taxi]
MLKENPVVVPSSVLGVVDLWNLSILNNEEAIQEALNSSNKKQSSRKKEFKKATQKKTKVTEDVLNSFQDHNFALEQLVLEGLNEATLNSEELYRSLKDLLTEEWSNVEGVIFKKKVKALQELHHSKRVADRMDHHWKYLILNQKLIQLIQTTSAEEVEAVLLQPKVYKGLVKIPATCTLQEEAIFWMEQSLSAPLSDDATNRYLSIVQKLFPEANIAV